mgnify:FL=1
MKTVCILTAGIGSRISKYTSYINKSLLPIKNKASISHIIESFPKETSFVVAVGYLKDQVKDYIKIAHSDRKINFVEIANYKGKNSGPGFSLTSCKNYLQKPFYFISCDTIWDKKIFAEGQKNWMGISSKFIRQNKDYCNLKTSKSKISNIIDKKKVNALHKHFIGLAYIYNYKEFWEGFVKIKKTNNEIQVINGFKSLLNISTIYTKKFNWYDVGTEQNYKKTLLKFEKYDFSKDNEFIYFVKDRVIKFFRSTKKTNKILKKSKCSDLFPTIDIKKDNFISYKFIPGQTLYENNNELIMKNLLECLKNNFWEKKNNDIKKYCKLFYYKKTKARISLYLKKYDIKKDDSKMINGLKVDTIDKLLNKVPWDQLYQGFASQIHGDLQFDNIIFNKNNSQFRLIDFREDFGGNIKVGDIYYDLAKLNGGIELNYSKIKKNQFKFTEKNASIEYSLKWKNYLYKKILKNYIIKNNFSYFRVQLITGLIFLNMCPLHKSPFDRLLFFHGKYILQKILK